MIEPHRRFTLRSAGHLVLLGVGTLGPSWLLFKLPSASWVFPFWLLISVAAIGFVAVLVERDVRYVQRPDMAAPVGHSDMQGAINETNHSSHKRVQ